ncbi:carboxymuconolactone decarboxylase family protein [Paenibacillus macquariensis]|uniref:hypothetical protein n=1 Tax=Paenibacillus macquariensis TaxID=948756 RepID=UPI00111593C7|nr:hypothetical protein [Paenibacillus macquariensis]
MRKSIDGLPRSCKNNSQSIADGGNVDSAVFPILREHFNDAQISELCVWICFIIASQWFGAAI